jgi:hypothetical protein
MGQTPALAAFGTDVKRPAPHAAAEAGMQVVEL